MTKSKWNRLLSVLLLVCLLASFAPAAYAEEPASVEEPAAEPADEPMGASTFALNTSCTVTLNANYPDGTNEILNKTVLYRTATGLSLATVYDGRFAMDGYVLSSWNTKANGSGTSYALDATVKGVTTLTLYAMWEKGYTVTYDDGAWGQAFAAQVYTVKAGEATPVFVGTPEYAGHTFLGWEPEVAETVTATATYKATWDPEPEKPTLKKPAGVTDSEVAEMEIRAYAVGTEGINPFNEMYSCTPSINAPGVSSYEIGQVYGNDIDGYFQDITFHFASGDDFEADARKTFNTDPHFTVLSGWTENFVGDWVYDFSRFSADQTLTLIWSSGDWHTENTLTEGGLTNIESNVANHIQVYLKLPTFFITYTDGVENEDLFADQSYEVKPDSATPAFEGTPEREGYTFDGWDPEVAETVTEDVTYTAVWKAVEYTLPVDPANGEDAYDVTITYDDVVGEKLETPVWDGRTFTGWVDQDGEPVDLEATYTEALKSVHATWTLVEYPVTVSPNNGQESYTLVYTYENVVGSKLETPVWEGHTFTGWVNQDGSPVDLTATYTAALTSINGTWELTKYVVPVDPCNGEDVTDVTYTYEDVIGSKYDFETEPERKGYTFEGWVDQDGNPVDLTATYTEDITAINASWKGKTYTVTFKLNEGEGTLSFTSKRVVNGDPLGYTPAVEREGYTFIGWYDENGKYYDSETIFDAARDITLTGRWIKTIVPTGDNSNPELFALMMLGSLACAGAIIIRLRKREDEV